jgi:MarR family 2-MHQ and catechol resistance regulon transcriptional repressor
MATPRRSREPHADRQARDAHVNVLIAANRFNEEIDRQCRDAGISHAQYVALWVLCLADDPETGVPMGAVSDGLFNRASDTTRLVDRLEKRGLAERLRNPVDRRGVLVRATAKGNEIFARLTPELKQYHRSQWSGLTEDELGELNRLLAKALWNEGGAHGHGHDRIGANA